MKSFQREAASKEAAAKEAARKTKALEEKAAAKRIRWKEHNARRDKRRRMGMEKNITIKGTMPQERAQTPEDSNRPPNKIITTAHSELPSKTRSFEVAKVPHPSPSPKVLPLSPVQPEWWGRAGTLGESSRLNAGNFYRGEDGEVIQPVVPELVEEKIGGGKKKTIKRKQKGKNKSVKYNKNIIKIRKNMKKETAKKTNKKTAKKTNKKTAKKTNKK